MQTITTSAAALAILALGATSGAQTRPTVPDGPGGKTTVSTGYILGKGQVTAAVSYYRDSYHRFWVGEEEMDLPPELDEITTDGLVVNIHAGLADGLELVANVPYTHSESASPLAPAPPQGAIGDMDLGLRWRFATLGQSTPTDLVASFNVHFPLEDYEPDLPVAIGDHTTDIGLGLIAFSRWREHFFTNLEGAIDLRSDDAPTDFRYLVQAGVDGAGAAASVRYEQLIAADTHDIGEGSFQSDREEFQRVGVNLFVRPWRDARYGFTGDLRWVVGGRNTGKPFGYSVGFVMEAGGR